MSLFGLELLLLLLVGSLEMKRWFEKRPVGKINVEKSVLGKKKSVLILTQFGSLRQQSSK